MQTEIETMELEVKSIKRHIDEYRRLCELERERIEGYVNYKFDRSTIPFKRILLTYIFSFFAFAPVSGISGGVVALVIKLLNSSWYFGYIQTFLLLFFLINLTIIKITRFGSRDLISRYEEKRYRESHRTEIEAFLSREDQITKWAEQVKTIEAEIEAQRNAENKN